MEQACRPYLDLESTSRLIADLLDFQDFDSVDKVTQEKAISHETNSHLKQLEYSIDCEVNHELAVQVLHDPQVSALVTPSGSRLVF